MPTAKGQALADEYGIKFFETVSMNSLFFAPLFFEDLYERLFFFFNSTTQSAKTNLNVEQVFFSIARDIKQRLAETDSKPEVELVILQINYLFSFANEA